MGKENCRHWPLLVKCVFSRSVCQMMENCGYGGLDTYNSSFDILERCPKNDFRERRSLDRDAFGGFMHAPGQRPVYEASDL